jgi:predicted nucleotidyltransferase component of viral defense system
MRVPQKHAGGKWQLKYFSFLGGQGNLEVDLNFMFRLPILQPSRKASRIVGGKKADNVLLMSYEEIAAGKLTALFARNASRDLFDTYYLLLDNFLDLSNFRAIFCFYCARSSIDA